YMDICADVMRTKCPKIYSQDLVNYLFFEFYTKNEYLRDSLGISRNTASKYLHELEDAGIVVSEQIGKEKIYKNLYLYELMKKW
ncbi:MAG: winged helix-turn-helix domain-containing protein, partial [Anaeroplasmataceae bacterium]|nr:winged helix-turn-helix domain-containing protein [Anaeroplasmataceae bacterium]